MQDGYVRDLMQEIDVDISMTSAMFDTFDPDGSGKVSMEDVVNAMMKLRGEPQKNDIVACWTAVRALQAQFDKFAIVLLSVVATSQGFASEGMDAPMGRRTSEEHSSKHAPAVSPLA